MRHHQTHVAPKLPQALLDQIPGGEGRSNNRNASSRKERRKNERQQKKTTRVQPRARPVRSFVRPPPAEPSSDDDEPTASSPPVKARSQKNTDGEQKPLKSILKQTKQVKPSMNDSESEDVPSTAIPRSRTVRDRSSREDAEIAALEKKLGMKKGKKRAQDGEDGFDALLDEIEGAVGGERPKKRKMAAEDEDWLEQKRRRVAGNTRADMGEDSLSDSEDGLDALENELEMGSDNGTEDSDLAQSLDDEGLDDSDKGDEVDAYAENDEEDDDVDSDLEGDMADPLDESDDQGESAVRQPRVRENPYLPPTTGEQVPVAKYIPPSLRKNSDADAESRQRLHRQVQGQLNRLTEANLLSILQAVEQFYQSNPRQYVTSSLIDILVGSISDKASLMDTFLILHAGFIAAVYKVIGTDFGAQIIERIVADLDGNLSGSATGKEANNLVSLLAELCKFEVISCGIVFDYIRLFIKNFTEDSTELLLKLVRTLGPQLRRDDPSSLKEIVIQVQKLVASKGEAKLSVRQKFMIETINDLKNNRMKTGMAASAVTSEHTVRMKKTLGSLRTRTLRANEPLRITLEDIRNTEKKGKWWLVGASYHDPAKLATNPDNDIKTDVPKKTNLTASAGDYDIDILQLAREQGMNTDIRRAIFVTLLSSVDYRDANVRLVKLNLTKKQALEIPPVIIQCVGAEENYNPYYGLVARKLCDDKQLRMAFQFKLWSLFRRMGERTEDDESGDEEDDDSALDLKQVLKFAKMFATLISQGALSVSVLKVLNIGYLQTKTQLFLEILFTSILVECKKNKGRNGFLPVTEVMSKALEVPEMVNSLRHFLETVVKGSDLIQDKRDRKVLSAGYHEAIAALSPSLDSD